MPRTSLSEIVRLCEGGLTPPFSITFREEDHQYWIDGENVPSVTQVVEQLHNFDGTNPEVMARAAARGTLIHKACELFALGVLDWDSVDESIMPEVKAFARWWKQSGFRPLLVESIIGSKRFRFACRLDFFGIWKTGLALVDLKTGGEYPAYAVQTAGQEIALWESLGLNVYGTTPIERYCLYLKGDKARPVRHENSRDHFTFLSALTCSHFRRENYP